MWTPKKCIWKQYPIWWVEKLEGLSWSSAFIAVIVDLIWAEELRWSHHHHHCQHNHHYHHHHLRHRPHHHPVTWYGQRNWDGLVSRRGREGWLGRGSRQVTWKCDYHHFDYIVILNKIIIAIVMFLTVIIIVLIIMWPLATRLPQPGASQWGADSGRSKPIGERAQDSQPEVWSSGYGWWWWWWRWCWWWWSWWGWLWWSGW